MNDAELVAALEAGTLPPGAFDHRAHVRAARHYLMHMSLPQAAHRFRNVLQAYVSGVGAADKFHLTMTYALMHLIHARMQGAATDWDSFAAANADLFANARALLARHYSNGRLMADKARRTFVEPDLAPLP